MKRASSLNSQSMSWRRRFLGALWASGLRLDEAKTLLANRQALGRWVQLIPDCLKDDEQNMSLAAQMRREFAAAAKLAKRWRVEEATPLDELDLTVSTYNLCAAAQLTTVNRILEQPDVPRGHLWKGDRVAVAIDELHNRLIAGGIAEPRLPSWLQLAK